LSHGAYDVFIEYGPAADRSYRTYLKAQYPELATLSRRWYGVADRLTRWDDVRVPEVAAFLGFNADALDLTGTWRLGYEPYQDGKSFTSADLRAFERKVIPTVEVPAAWYQPDFDDAAWPSVTAPGHDRAMFLEKRPAVYRRTIEVPAAWVKPGQRTWLYVWDLNAGEHLRDKIIIAVNGMKIGEDFTRHAQPHWCALEVTSALKAGPNCVAVRVPRGFLGYRVYLAAHEPRQYPDLGLQHNAQWVDFSTWRQWTRYAMARRGTEMIRQADPDRSIVYMAPDKYVTGLKRLAEEYGGRFHNTGYMGAWWAQFLPALMRGSDLPFSLEPGGPAGDLPGFKKQMGLYLTEGVQAVHYFIHVGNIFWNAPIRRDFEENQPLYRTIGKVHQPKAEIAMLYSDRIDNLTGYPWGTDPNTNLSSGYHNWPLDRSFVGRYDFDGLTELDFAAGHARPYRLVIGANVSVMDAKTVSDIEEWVKAGGIFVAFVQTGRHTPEGKDAWPISRLTGYRVNAISRVRPDGEVLDWWKFTLAPGQRMFKAEDWPPGAIAANGLKLEKIAPECQDLLTWEDGSTAIGLRPLGKGYVIHMGLKFCRDPLWNGWPDRTERLFRQLFEWAKITRIAAAAEGVTLRHFVSNNGLYDVWTLWNSHDKQPVDTRLSFRDGLTPVACVEVKTNAPVALTGQAGGLETPALRFDPLETKIFLTPRRRLTTAPLEWLTLQRNWWRGTKKPAAAPLPNGVDPAVLDLTRAWSYRTLEETSTEDLTPSARPDVDVKAWPVRDLTVWTVPDELPSRHLFARKTFTVPAAWHDGTITLWLRSWFAKTVMGTARVWLDGTVTATGQDGAILPVDLKAGTTHTLAVEIKGEGQAVGVRGNTWLAYTPHPQARLDLAGAWLPTRDLLSDDAPLTLPGPIRDLKALRRQILIPDVWRGKQVYLYARVGWGTTGAIVNGAYVRRHHHQLGEVTLLNITPWINVGATNELELLVGGRTTVHEVALWAYDRAP
jgi:hypothetical protein